MLGTVIYVQNEKANRKSNLRKKFYWYNEPI